MRAFSISFAVVVIVVGVVSCSSPPQRSAASANEAAAIAATLTARMKAGDAGDDLFDFDGRIDDVAAGMPVSGFNEWIRRGASARGTKIGLGGKAPTAGLIEILKAGGHVDLLRVRSFDGVTSALFHFSPVRGGLGYIEFLVGKVDGQVRFIDFVPSQACTTAVVSNLRLGMSDRGEGSDIGNGMATYGDGADMKAMGDAIAAERYQEALDVFARMPARLQQERTVLVLRLAAARHVSPEATTASLVALRAGGTDALCTEMSAFDIAFENDDFASALKSANAIDVAVGGDPLVDFMRSIVFLNTHDAVAAIAADERARAHLRDGAVNP